MFWVVYRGYYFNVFILFKLRHDLPTFRSGGGGRGYLIRGVRTEDP